MWRPDEVVSRHKYRAVALWVILIISIIGYFSYLIAAAFETAKHPNTSLTVSNEVYRYPDLWMCMYDYYGCDDINDEEECVSSANSTEGGVVSAVYHPGGENEQEIDNYYTLTLTRGWCLVFKTSDVVVELGNTRDADDYLDHILIDMSWYPGGGVHNSTTCVSEEGEWTEHSESIFGFLNDTETGVVSTGIQVPYTCMTNESTSYAFTNVGIGLTKMYKLDSDDNVFSYKATTTSSLTYKIERTTNITGIQAPYAHVAMNFAQQPDSLEEITDISPFEIAELLGNVGGFWDLLLILWPIFFVTSGQQDPHSKSRNFRKSLAKARDSARNITAAPFAGVSARRPSRPAVEEEVPSWERSSREQQGSEVLIRLFDEHQLVAVINGSAVKKFLKSTFGAKSLKEGAPERVLKKLLPEKTYLILVPPGSTTTSIAKAVAGYCRLGGDNAGTENAEPIMVKARLAQCSVVQAQTLNASEYVGANDEIGNEPEADLGEAELCPTPAAMPQGRRPSTSPIV